MSTRGNPHLIIRLDPAVKAEIEQTARCRAMDTSTFIRQTLVSAIHEDAPGVPGPPVPVARRARRVSRLARFKRAHEELAQLLAEYEDWHSGIPESQ